MSNYKLKNGIDAIRVCENLYNFSKNLSPDIQTAFANKILLNLNVVFEGMQKLSEEDYNAILTCLVEKKDLLSFICKTSKLKYKIEALVLKLDLACGMKLYRLVNRR